jgi:hypothetical protein
MELSEQLIKDMLGSYLETTFARVLPALINKAIHTNDLFNRSNPDLHLCRRQLGKELPEFFWLMNDDIVA